MHGLDEFESGQDGTVFRDVIMLALLGFMVIVVVLLPHLNPPTKAAAEEPPGNIIIEVRWTDNLDADVDLWVKAPNDRPVGYSNQSGQLINLLRDDLGRTGDATGLNYEVAYSRGFSEGEFVVNLHLYGSAPADLPLSANVTVKIKRGQEAQAKAILSKTVTLRLVGEELTVARFALDADGLLLADSVHDMPLPLRTSQLSGG